MGEIGGLNSATFRGLEAELWSRVDYSPTEITYRIVLTIVGSAVLIFLIKSLAERVFNRSPSGIINLTLFVGATIG